ncbi:DUF4082 domain-containing protein [Saccharothrix syringae]|uniref:DUF4082 domain-containing protein n=1 Tax=Saccharothrix syringae TaxID=103733 RepID=A0A5Q0GS98_SACSY|nr:DUF4082 domain-containing protein [Saccharothrix syringae]QFZ16242.1 DUF4082 domain-containing protein [Saccharothrix syringae]
MSTNAITAENRRPGSPRSEWDLDGPASTTIEGFTTSMSVNRGERVEFKINTDSPDYRVDIYRLGYYGGLGARKVATIQCDGPSVQPPPGGDPAIGLYDAGNWDVTTSWDVPADAVSGVHLAKLVRQDGVAGASHVVFVVRDDGVGHDIVFQTSDTTWQAYNGWGGANLYGGNATASPDGRAYKVSYNRPFRTRDGVGLWAGPQDFVLSAEHAAIRWLERNGYDVTYISGVDTGPGNAALTDHRVFMSTGHDEYWSGDQRAHVEAARDAGVHLVFISGNEVYWRTRWEPDLNGTPARTLVTYKETRAGEKTDPSPQWTGTWRDTLFSPPADGGRPENALTGTIFQVDSHRADVIEVPHERSRLRFWRDTKVATTAPGETASLSPGLLGYEWDEAPDNRFRPPGSVAVSDTTVDVRTYLVDYGTATGQATARHRMVLHRAPSGAIVFGAGTVFWSFGLDTEHDTTNSGPVPDIPEDQDVQQAMVNLFADMGVQPATLQPDLVRATGSTDTTAPVAVITSPAAGASFVQQEEVVISGTASDVGGQVGVVEVSTDGGRTWWAADGTTDWTFSWWPRLPGSYRVLARAVDDSLNAQSPGAAVRVTVTPAASVSLFTPADVPFALRSNEANALELGVKFTVNTPGSVTGLRFYKNPADTGAHVGHLWTAGGVLLAKADYTDETASGWQQAEFDEPVVITPGSTYIASYHTAGFYSADRNYFTTARTGGAVTAPAGTATSGNGVYAYGAPGTFPNSTYRSNNYWVDVVFERAGGAGDLPPTATNDSGFTARAGAPLVIPAEGLLANDTDPNGYPLSITGVSAPVGGTVTWSAATQRVTFTPAAGFSGQATFRYSVTNGRTPPVQATVSVVVPPQAVTQTLFKPTDHTPAIINADDPNPVQVGTRFRCAVAGGVARGIRFYKGPLNTGAHVAHLWTDTGTLLATANFTGETTSGWQQADFATPVALSPDANYIASYHTNGRYSATTNFFAVEYRRNDLVAPADGAPAGNGVYAYGAPGTFPDRAYRSTNYWVDVVVETPPPVVHGLFADDEAPTTPVVVDARPLQVGVRFRAAAPNAAATGIRFYKGQGNTGAHVAHLWTDTGTLLATANFTGETTGGWQQADFATPVALSPDVTYIASYHTDGRYSATPNFFTADRVRGPLIAPADGNGVFAYGLAGSFPNSSFNATNYWVDVVVRTG